MGEFTPGGTRVVIADDDSLVRRAIAAYLADVEDIVLIGEAANGREAVEVAERTQPDIVLMDIRMPEMDGIEATAQITASQPQTRVLAITTLATAESVVPVLRAGAAGYLLKDAPVAAILDGIRAVHSGSGALSPEVSGELIRALRATEARAPRVPTEAETVSKREQAVVQQLATGKSNGEIARELHLSEGTVKAHLGSVMRKWDARDRVQVLIAAARFGLVSLH